MKNNLIILHIGNSNVSFTRFIDILQREELKKLIIFTTSNDNLYDKIMSSCGGNPIFEDNKHKLIPCVYKLNHTYLLVQKIFNYSIRLSFFTLLIKSFLNKMEFLIDIYLKFSKFPELNYVLNKYNPDFIWSGSHNFDNSNLLTWFVSKKTKVKIVRSYKETNGTFMLDEKKALKVSDVNIFPTQSYTQHFLNLYPQIDLKSKSIYYGDEDWRYSGLINYMSKEVVQKYSSVDNIPHIVILTGRATFGKNDSFTNNRYNYINLINEFINKGVHVHLHCAFFYNSDINKADNSINNPYYNIQMNNSFFHVEEKINLENSFENYKILKKYDAGILHNYNSSDEISVFSKINIPNRLYEYQMCNVRPILIYDTMEEVEKIISNTNFGFLGHSYEDICSKMKEFVKNSIQPEINISTVNSYNDFSDIILNKII